MKKVDASVIFILIIIFVSFGFIYFGRAFPFRSKVIPFLVALFVLFLAIIQILFETIPKFKKKEIGKIDLFNTEQVKIKQEKITEEKEWAEKYENKEKRLFDIIKWILILTLGIYLLGFLVTLPIFMFLFYFIKCGYRWTKALGTTFLFWVIIYLVFELFLRAELYRGIILMSI
ncbi:MAG: tripartite tricarboxylate transporter TctB family protein [Candidatus Lokiarchaeota archaeon]|nr:tripartite tricarboxylate transporter TctB family protein [Candidatus Lokiarchaeota archaeon]